MPRQYPYKFKTRALCLRSGRQKITSRNPFTATIKKSPTASASSPEPFANGINKPQE